MKKGEQKPEWAKSQSSREAMHWLTTEILVMGDMVARKPATVVACGQALDEIGHRQRTTKDSTAVTCWACAQLAHQRGALVPKLQTKANYFAP